MAPHSCQVHPASTRETKQRQKEPGVTLYLRYEETPGGVLNNFEGHFSYKIGQDSSIKSVFARYGPFGDPNPHLRLLDTIRTTDGEANFGHGGRMTLIWKAETEGKSRAS